ncbi:glycosyltransferase family 4 protein [Psychroserpens mesophilus]|uniref:glycosyltransferase family 4 protein n=1 Tax=Psychroserpens mesophilus TaxID=325473 RepID=UPI000590D577|nr:glycosyltransferase family 4 protein [Psychroserpens mesophilus]
MKILIFYTYNKGPLSSFFEELSLKLSKRGHEVTNFYLKHRKEHTKKGDLHIYGEKRKSFVLNYYHIYRIIKQTKPNVIISNFSYVNPALLFGSLLHVNRNICWFHTVYGHSKPNWLKVFNKKLHLKLADAIIANSKILKGELNTIYGYNEEKIYAIPFWTNISNYQSEDINLDLEKDEACLYIGCPGRLVKDKNHTIVIDALSELKKKSDKKIKLFIAGSGSYEDSLKAHVKKCNLNNDVVFLGLLSTAEMLSFYKQMDVVVLPSLNEAFGLVFIEAISLGTPVIVSSQFGSLAFIDSNEHDMERFTFNPKSKTDLVKKLEPYLNTPQFESDYFKDLYNTTFEKSTIFKKIAHVITKHVE